MESAHLVVAKPVGPGDETVRLEAPRAEGARRVLAHELVIRVAAAVEALPAAHVVDASHDGDVEGRVGGVSLAVGLELAPIKLRKLLRRDPDPRIRVAKRERFLVSKGMAFLTCVRKRISGRGSWFQKG